MNLDRLLPGLVKKQSKTTPMLFKHLSPTHPFTPINLYDLNDMVFKDVMWAPNEAFTDSVELRKIKLLFLPVHRQTDGTLRHLVSKDGFTSTVYQPTADDVGNDLAPLINMVERGMATVVEGWDLGTPDPFPHFFTMDQLQQYVDATVVGVTQETTIDSRVETTNENLVVLVVLNLRAEVYQLLKEDTQFNWIITDQHLNDPNEEDKLHLYSTESTDNLYAYITSSDWDAVVTIQPGLN